MDARGPTPFPGCGGVSMRSRLTRPNGRRGSFFVAVALGIGLAVADPVPELEKKAV